MQNYELKAISEFSDVKEKLIYHQKPLLYDELWINNQLIMQKFPLLR